MCCILGYGEENFEFSEGFVISKMVVILQLYLKTLIMTDLTTLLHFTDNFRGRMVISKPHYSMMEKVIMESIHLVSNGPVVAIEQ